ncbi:murein L,D-transpeptidase [Nocardioides marmoriginsengisoli]|uniref:Murein L,D-transpeptidase n=1 Tax=Nocardioides marmoriginsengisoli TaxID=661483 RepID=A0A3N0CTE2_9ACTN|nr:L,D-transpeptidase [Nocardioides marmoriginsengisoli]RNL66213.1 murein L,D-transpeptidase [Nocardioides marmoriginsengisoli]
MSKHRLEPPPRVRPRVGRIAAAVVSLTVTVVALLGGLDVIPLGGAGSALEGDQTPTSATADLKADPPTGSDPVTPKSTPSSTPTPAAPKTTTTSEQPPSDSSARTSGTALPAGSGSGRRVVFSMSGQRVWLVDAKGATISTYLVSGSLTNNLKPGKYDVYSRSRWAVGIDDSGVMQYFVRFTRGDNAAIGFHSIPTKDGKALQTEKQLGTPQSHGCIRQKLSDAVRMWGFAQDGTDVVVLA